ncbi:MAG: type II secretion system F family protein [Candidatus Saccharibacteria bacterium]|nr:type II secretion system F family protein [Candidatus Saccharibacteria bacterium]
MPDYIYKTIDPSTGKQVSVNISANNQNEATNLVLERGLQPIQAKQKRANLLGGLTGRIKRRDKILFTNQLSTLISAGLPLLQSLQQTSLQMKNKNLKRIIDDIVSSIESGSAFSDALAEYPKYFDQIYINLVKAGEASGTLDTSLERLAIQQEKDGDLVSKIKGALIYPIIVVFVIIGVVSFMLIFVLPQVVVFYEQFDKPLPWITRVLIAVSDSLVDYYYVYILVALGAVIALNRALKTPKGKSFADHSKLKFPAVKSLMSKVYMARFTRTVGTLFASGVNLLETLAIIAKGINNMHLEAAINRSSSLVREGKSLSSSLENEPLFLDLVPSMISIGEQSGRTEEMLLKAAVYYEKEVDKQIKALTTTMEPVLILTVGGIAIVIVLAILLPVYSLIQDNPSFGAG